MASSKHCFLLFLMVALSLSSINASTAARHLLDTAPPPPTLTQDTLPSVSAMPPFFLPATLPPMPATAIPPLPSIPNMPMPPTLPPMPSTKMPPLPKPTLPPMPTIPNVALPHPLHTIPRTIPSIPFIPITIPYFSPPAPSNA